MKLRPFAWVIIAINAYFIVSFFMDYDPNGDSTANGIGIMVLLFWLAIINVVLYVFYRITGSRKSDVNVTLESQLKEIDHLKASGLITDEEVLKALKRKSLDSPVSGFLLKKTPSVAPDAPLLRPHPSVAR
jgi:hypothetical protein